MLCTVLNQNCKARSFSPKSIFGQLTVQCWTGQTSWMPQSSISCMHSLGWGHWQTISLAQDAAGSFMSPLALLPSHDLVIEKGKTYMHSFVTIWLRKCSVTASINNNVALNVLSFLYDRAKVSSLDFSSYLDEVLHVLYTVCVAKALACKNKFLCIEVICWLAYFELEVN